MADHDKRVVRRRSKTPLLATLGLILVVGSVTGWGVAKYLTTSQEPGVVTTLPQIPDAPEGALETAPVETARGGEVETRLDATPEVNKNMAPVAAQPIETKGLKIVVDSYAPGDGGGLAEWKRGEQLSGYFDSVVLKGAVLAKDATPKLLESDVITLSGWAGDVNVGIRYPFVLASACGVVFASSAVTEDRSDVARAVHPNLLKSGWRMRVSVSSLPVCADRAIRVWGVAPGKSRLILPLNGRFLLSSGAAVPKVAPKGNPEAEVIFATPLSYEKMTPLESLTVTVRANTLNMRRCGAAKCAVTGKIRKGDWTVVKMDENADWILIATPDRAGWVARKFVQLSDQ